VLGAGLQVPGDIAVVGYDDMPFAASETLSLTTMHQPIDRMATQCIDCVIARIQDPDGPGTRVLLSPHLVARRSTLGSKFDSEVTQERKGPRGRRASPVRERIRANDCHDRSLEVCREIAPCVNDPLQVGIEDLC
jgi:hypothetical protein